MEACLARMAGSDTAMVRELPRRSGQQDSRWVHLLGPVEAPDATGGPAAVDRESVLAAGAEARDDKVRAAYAAVAVSYAEQLCDELAGLPFESWLLRRVVDLSDGAPVIEVGTGPGHVAAFLAEAGADVTGLDLTPQMVDEARRRYPGVNYQVGDLRRLMRPTTYDGWGAVLAWYSLIHLAASELPAAIGSLARPLRPTAGWCLPCTPAPRYAPSPTGSATRSTSTSCCMTLPMWSRSWNEPACAISSGTTAVRSPRAAKPPSASTSSPASRSTNPSCPSVSLDGCVIRGG